MKRRLLTLLAGIGSILGMGTSVAEPLEIGGDLPKVEAKTQKGKTINLAEAAGKGYALFFFYPKAATPG